MSEQTPPPQVNPVPRIIPPHPRFPGKKPTGAKPILRPVQIAASKRQEIAAADQAEQVVIAKLSEELGSVVLFSERSEGGVAFADPKESEVTTSSTLFPSSFEVEETADPEQEDLIFEDSSELTDGSHSAAALEESAQEAMEEEHPQNALKGLRQPTPSGVVVSGESSPFNQKAPEEKKGFWAALTNRRKESEEEEEASASLEPWVGEEDDEDSSQPTVRSREIAPHLPPRSRNSFLFGSKWRALAAAAMICVLAAGLWIFWNHDGVAPDDANLAPITLETDRPNNIHRQLAGFLNEPENLQITSQISGIPRLTDADSTTLESLVRENTPALKLILDCLEEENWQPSHPAWKSANLGGDLPWKELALIKQAEAIHYQRNGLEVNAFRAGFDLMEFGLKVQKVKAWPNYFLTGTDIYQRGVETIKILIDHTRMDSDQLGALQRTFASTMHQPPTRADLESFFRASYGLEKAILSHDAEAPPRPGISSYLIARPEGITFKRNQTLTLFADAFSTLIDNAKNPLAEPNKIPVDLTESENASLLDNNRTGHQYFAKVMKAYLSAPAKQAKSVADFNLVKTQFAIRRFNLDTGRLPETLSELSPNYLKGIPSDPFNGDTLRYSKVKKVVYSAGVDGIDEGGSTGRAGFMNANEPTLELVFGAGEFH